MKLGHIKFTEQQAWRDQSRKDACEWSRIHVKDEALLTAYAAGFTEGWRQCIATLKIQGRIKEDVN